MTLSAVVMHLGPHNAVEWLIYGALTLLVVGVGLLVIRTSDRHDPTGGFDVKRRRR